jgi:hypothetical protein
MIYRCVGQAFLVRKVFFYIIHDIGNLQIISCHAIYHTKFRYGFSG